MNKIITLVLTGISCLCVLTAVASRLLFGTGAENPVFQATGIYNGYFFIAGLVGLFLALLVNHFTRGVFIAALRDQSQKDRIWLHEDFLQNPKVFVGIHILIFTVLSFVYFNAIKDVGLFLGVDGNYTVAIALQQKIWMAHPFAFGANFLESLGGNIWFPINTLVDPGYIIATIGGGLNVALAHTIWGLLLFGSTLILARTVRLNWICSILASWLSACLILYPSHFQFSPVPLLIPHLATSIAVSNLILALIVRRSDDLKSGLWRALGLTLAILYFALHNPTFLLVAFPVAALCAGFKLFSLQNRQALIHEAGVFAVPVFFALVSGLLAFIAGLYLDTAVFMFPDDFMVESKTMTSISSFFYHPLIALTIAFAFMGILSAVLRRNVPAELQILARGSGVLCLLIFAIGFIYIKNPEIWDGPSLNYFEFMLWPVYGIFIAYFIMRILAFLQLKTLPAKIKKPSVKYAPYAIALLPVAFFLLLSRNAENQKFWPFPPPNSPIMEKLADTAHQPGDDFKGRVATFTGLNINETVSWNDLQRNDYAYLSNFGNDFRKAGLWYNNIPTLTEYNQLITPRFYLFAKTLFEKEDDSQVRNMVTMREINPAFLRLAGVNRLVTDRWFPGGYRLLAREYKEGNTIYLYAFRRPNLTGWSPVRPRVFDNFEKALNILKNPRFNPEREVLVEMDLEDTRLVPAYNKSLSVGRSAYEISAESRGTSLLVLPVEYSACLKMKAQSDGEREPEIIPVNIAFSGILFEKNLEAELTYRNGPFINPACRFKDYREFKEKL